MVETLVGRSHRWPNEEIERIKKLMEKGNAMAYYQFGGDYAHGTNNGAVENLYVVVVFMP